MLATHGQQEVRPQFPAGIRLAAAARGEPTITAPGGRLPEVGGRSGGAGDWFSSSVPGGTGVLVGINNITGAQTINLSATTTIGSLFLGDRDGSHPFTIANPMTVVTGSSGTKTLAGIGTNTTTYSGGTRGGSGTVAGNVAVASNGNLAPGTSIGTLAIKPTP